MPDPHVLNITVIPERESKRIRLLNAERYLGNTEAVDAFQRKKIAAVLKYCDRPRGQFFVYCGSCRRIQIAVYIPRNNLLAVTQATPVLGFQNFFAAPV